MRYFSPNVVLSSELPVQDCLEEKFGGLPWGLRIDQVPLCSHCGKYQTLIAQLLHHPVRLNLGASGRVLFVFMCEQSYGVCPSWQGGGGANACFVVEPHDLGDGLTDILYESFPPHEEVRILDWLEGEDGVSADQVADFYDDDTYGNLPDDLVDIIPQTTKLGGVPVWCQSASERPDGWRFVGQIEESHGDFNVPLGNYNFGTGSAYIFLRYQSDKPEGLFFWQC